MSEPSATQVHSNNKEAASSTVAPSEGTEGADRTRDSTGREDSRKASYVSVVAAVQSELSERFTEKMNPLTTNETLGEEPLMPQKSQEKQQVNTAQLPPFPTNVLKENAPPLYGLEQTKLDHFMARELPLKQRCAFFFL